MNGEWDRGSASIPRTATKLVDWGGGSDDRLRGCVLPRDVRRMESPSRPPPPSAPVQPRGSSTADGDCPGVAVPFARVSALPGAPARGPQPCTDPGSARGIPAQRAGIAPRHACDPHRSRIPGQSHAPRHASHHPSIDHPGSIPANTLRTSSVGTNPRFAEGKMRPRVSHVRVKAREKLFGAAGRAERPTRTSLRSLGGGRLYRDRQRTRTSAPCSGRRLRLSALRRVPRTGLLFLLFSAGSTKLLPDLEQDENPGRRHEWRARKRPVDPHAHGTQGCSTKRPVRPGACPSQAPWDHAQHPLHRRCTSRGTTPRRRPACHGDRRGWAPCLARHVSDRHC